MTGREQTRQDKAIQFARGWTAKPLPTEKISPGAIYLVATAYLALLAELEQAEQERDEWKREAVVISLAGDR